MMPTLGYYSTTLPDGDDGQPRPDVTRRGIRRDLDHLGLPEAPPEPRASEDGPGAVEGAIERALKETPMITLTDHRRKQAEALQRLAAPYRIERDAILDRLRAVRVEVSPHGRARIGCCRVGSTPKARHGRWQTCLMCSAP